MNKDLEYIFQLMYVSKILGPRKSGFFLVIYKSICHINNRILYFNLIKKGVMKNA